MELLDVQRYISDAINADPSLADAGVKAVPEDLGDAFEAVDASLADLGICALVQLPRFKPESNASKNVVGIATVSVVVTEIPQTNRTQAGHIHALSAAERIAWLLNLAKPAPADTRCDVLVLDPQGIQPEPQADGRGLVVGVTFRWQHQITGTPPATY